MTDVLFPLAEDMSTLVDMVGAYVVYGAGLAIVCWTIGYVVWFIIQFIR